MLKNKTIIGIFWSFLEQVCRRGIAVFVTLLLAYFLSPQDYGLLALITLFLALGGTLVESGFKQAIIRKSLLTDLDINTAFYSNLVLSLIAYFLIYLAAPLIASYYSEEKLVNLIRIASIIIIINSFQIVQIAVLSKKMNFKGLLKANLPAAVLSGITAVFLAYLDFGVWALVGQMLTFSTLFSILIWLQSTWRPKFCFSITSFVEMYKYGYKLFLSSVLEVFYKNIFVLIIAKSFSVGIAGLYFFADRIKELLITQLITSIQTVTFPALSVIQNDIDRLKVSYKKILQIMTFLVFPILLIFSALSELIFKVFLPDKWLPSVIYLQLMCLSSLIIPIISINLNIIKVKGYSNWYLQLEIFKKVTGFMMLFITIEYGVIAILVGQLVSQFLNYYPSVYMSNKIVEYSLLEQLQDFMPNLFLSLIVASIIWFLQYIFIFNPLIELLVFGCISLVLYIGIAYLIKLRSLHLALSLFNSINK